MEKPTATRQLPGQPWFDVMDRHSLTSGEMQVRIQNSEIAGLTIVPTFFRQILIQRDDYDPSIRQWALKGKTVSQILDHLLIEDTRMAAGLLLQLFKRTEGEKGFVSIPLEPRFAHDPPGSLREAQRLWKAIKYPNLMIQIPATQAGLETIKQCIADGLNVHATMIFTPDRYTQVTEAYLQGLEHRAEAGKKLHNVFSIADFSLHCLDQRVDQLLEGKRAAAKGQQKLRCRELKGKASLSTVRLVCSCFHEKYSTDRFSSLAQNGAHLQKLLWDETPLVIPAFPDSSQEETVMGKPMITLVSPAMKAAVDRRGQVRLVSAVKVNKARKNLDQLSELEIQVNSIYTRLEEEKHKSFSAVHDSILTVIAEKREAVLLEARLSLSCGNLEEPLGAALAAMATAQFEKRIWALDPTLWKADEPIQQEEISKRMGWLKIIDWMQTQVDGINLFVDRVRRAGFTHALLCGMGGSSLAPEVLRETFGVTKGYLDLMVLDSTDPAAVLAAGARSNLESTLFIISTKSGSTVETSAFFQYFWEKLRTRKGLRAGENFVAITDPGTAMEQAARKCQFRHIFLNPPDIGGRYSALSFVGLVPAALMGINAFRLLERAKRLAMACGPRIVPTHNPAFILGALMGIAALNGRDKLTLIVSEKISTFGAWIEQLVAESTGKEGRGIVPIEGEPLGNYDLYGKDRLFVYLRIGSKLDKYVNALIKADHPVITFHLEDGFDLGAEFLRWQLAVASACWILNVNPFDQPNVQEAKDLTREILTEYANKGRIPMVAGALSPRDSRFQTFLSRHLHSIKKGDYVGLTAFFERNLRRIKLLQEIRTAIRSLARVPTTVGFGPSYLHSTGQLHKGGTNNSVFIQFCAYDNMEAEVPGTHYTFDKLIAAQAMGDYAALEGRHRRILLVDLEKDVEGGLRRTLSIIQGQVVKAKQKSTGISRTK